MLVLSVCVSEISWVEYIPQLCSATTTYKKVRYAFLDPSKPVAAKQGKQGVYATPSWTIGLPFYPHEIIDHLEI